MISWQLLCRSWIAAGRPLTSAAAKAAVVLSEGPSNHSLLLQALAATPEAASCNALLSHCSAASSAPLASDLLQLMVDCSIPLAPSTLSALLRLPEPSLPLRALSWYLSGGTHDAPCGGVLEEAARKLPGGCIEGAAMLYIEAGRADDMLALLAACHPKTVKGRLQPVAEALAAANSDIPADVFGQLVRLGIAADDVSFVAWQVSHLLASCPSWQALPDMLERAVLLLVAGGQPAAASVLLQHHIQDASSSSSSSSRADSNEELGLHWQTFAVAAIDKLQRSSGRDAAASLELVQLCLKEGAGLDGLRGRAAGAAAKAGLWKAARKLLAEVRRGSVQDQQQLLLSLVGLEVVTVGPPDQKAFLVSCPAV
jgi:hypothetical protein